MLRVSAIAEKAGLPTACLVSEGFVGLAKASSEGLAMPDLGLAIVPGHPDVQSSEELRKNVLEVTLPQVIQCLTLVQEHRDAADEPQPREIVCVGSFAEVNQFFYERRWTDGIPIVPPTQESVAAFLACTDRSADEVLGTMLPDNRAATIWNIAVNGVMAGCRPEYMPVLIALVEVMLDPGYGIEHSGNTPGSEAQIVIDGPIVKQLGLNFEQGALRDGFQANTSIGRFWRLYLINVVGFQRHLNDKATFGGTWRVAMAENNDVLDEIGWSSVCEDFGIPRGTSGVCVSRFTGGHVIVSVSGKSAQECLPYVAECVKSFTTWELIFTVGMTVGKYRPMLILSPIIARTIARSGFSKEDVQRYLFEHARLPALQFERFMGGYNNLVSGRKKLVDLVALRKAPKVFAQSRDPDRLVPIVASPQDFVIAVSGDPLRTNCYFLSHNGFIGYPTAKQVKLPANWPLGQASINGVMDR